MAGRPPRSKIGFELEPGVPAAAQVLNAVCNKIAMTTSNFDNITPSTLKGKYAKYALAPDKFIWEILGVKLTKDAKRICQSLVDAELTLAKSANGIGKSHLAAHIAIWFFLTFPESKVYLFAAPPEKNLRQILWGAIGNIYRRNPYIFDGMKVSMPSMLIERHSESFLTGVTIPVSIKDEDTEARFSGKHAPDMLFIGDEADAIPAAVFKGIESCASGGHVRQLYNFNPRQESGTMAQMEKDGRANVIELSAFRHPNVICGKNIVPGAVTREVTIRRIHNWTKPLAAHEQKDGDSFEVPNFLIGVTAKAESGQEYPPLSPGTRTIIDPQFAYKVLGRYPTQSDTQLISSIWIDRAFSNWDKHVSRVGESPPPNISPSSGQDVADFGPDLNTLFHRYNWFVPSPEIWSGVDPDITAKRCAKSCNDKHSKRCNVDSNGVGASVVFAMKRHYKFDRGVRILVQESAPENPNAAPDEVQGDLVRDEMLWMLREWLRLNMEAALPPIPNLREELLAPKYWENKKGKIKITDTETLKEELRRSPDLLMGLALTFARVGVKSAKVVSQTYSGQMYDRNAKVRKPRTGVLLSR